jgi:hypothetical protein
MEPPEIGEGGPQIPGWNLKRRKKKKKRRRSF